MDSHVITTVIRTFCIVWVVANASAAMGKRPIENKTDFAAFLVVWLFFSIPPIYLFFAL